MARADEGIVEMTILPQAGADRPLGYTPAQAQHLEQLYQTGAMPTTARPKWDTLRAQYGFTTAVPSTPPAAPAPTASAPLATASAAPRTSLPSAPPREKQSLFGRLQEQMSAPLPSDVSPTVEAFAPEAQKPALLEPEHMTRMAEALGINLAGAYLGGRLGAAMGPAAPVAIPIGAALGSYAARRFNVAQGLESPGLGGDVLAVAPSLVGGVAKGVLGAEARYGRAGRALRATDEAVAARQAAIQAHEGAVQTARTMGRQFAPPVPARVLYQQLEQQAGQLPVTMTAANSAAQEVLGQLATHFEAMQPHQIQSIAVQVLATQRADVQNVVRWLQDLGPLTRRGVDGRIRAAARQLYTGLQDALTTVPNAPPLLRQANAAARRQFALEDLGTWIRQTIRRGNDNLPRVEPGPLLRRIEAIEAGQALSAEEQLFRGSFTQQEWNTLRGNVGALANLSRIPPVPPAPTIRPPSAWRLAAELMAPTFAGAMHGSVGPYMATGMTLAGVDALEYGLSRLLLQPNMQPVLRRLILTGGRVDPRALAIFNAAVQMPLTTQPQGQGQ